MWPALVQRLTGGLGTAPGDNPLSPLLAACFRLDDVGKKPIADFSRRAVTKRLK